MSFTTPIFVPLVKGLDLSVESMLGGQELTIASNIDFPVQGRVQGRPSRAAVRQFQVRDPAGSDASPTYLASAALGATGFSPCGLMRVRDATGERAFLGTHGRLFGLEGTEWKDRGAFGCFKVDRVASFTAQNGSNLVARTVKGPDFGCHVGDDDKVSLLNPTTLGFERFQNLASLAADVGGAAKCGTVTATVYRQTANPTNLVIVLRSAGGTLTEATIATDCAVMNDDGDAASICCDHDQTVFFVAYQTTTANQYKVLKVTTAGVVSATFTGSLAGIHGIWVSNGPTAANRVVVALTNANGLTLKMLTASTMADAALDSTHAIVGINGKECVVGVESATRAWWAYRGPDTTSKGLYIGTVDPTTALSAVVVKVYYPSALVLTTYTPMHQPVVLGGRVYLTVGAVFDINSIQSDVGTWFTLDLSNLKAGSTAGPFAKPTVVARGRADGTAFRPDYQPESAVLVTNGWTFVTNDWATYNVNHVGQLAGQFATANLNRVTLHKPRCALVGGSILFSGSVPRQLAGDQCYEAGFPLRLPQIRLTVTAGGSSSNTVGSRTVYACWAYTDGAGQVHRSGATSATATLANTTDYIATAVEPPWFSERPDGDLRIEVYCTGPNPETDDPAHLQATVAPDFTTGHTTYNVGQSAAIVTDTDTLYILEDEFAHFTPNADGGIAALGRRIWAADRDTVYGSLLTLPNQGTTWNDEGSLSATLPAGAGRIVAIEGLDDKLVIFCERGIYALQDGGPDNAGQGPDIAFPVRLSDLGCAGPRATCTTDRGVCFVAPLDSTDAQRGGPWLLDRSLSLTERKYLGTPAMDAFLASGTWSPEVAFSPERQQLYITSNQVASQDPPTIGSAGGALTLTDAAASEGVVVVDFRAEKWSTWDLKRSWGTLRSIEVVSGVLWALNDDPAPFSGAPGSDASGGDYSMRVRTAHIAGNGTDGGGWARVRSVSPMAAIGATTHTLNLYAWADEERCATSGALTQTTPAVGATWPTNRLLDEWRLPTQKCSTLQVELSASPATARWAAVRLDVQPLSRRAPAKQRT